MSDLVTKVRIKNSNATGGWDEVPIGVQAKNVILDKQPMFLQDYLNVSAGGRNYFIGTSTEKVLYTDYETVGEESLEYKGINDSLYSTYQGKSLKELGFKEREFVTLSFDWQIENFDSETVKKEPVELENIAWNETGSQPDSVTLIFKGLNDEGEQKIYYSYDMNLDMMQYTTTSETVSIDKSRYIYTNSNNNPNVENELSTDSYSLQKRELSLNAPLTGKHEKTIYLDTANLLKIRELYIQSPGVLLYQQTYTETPVQGEGDISETIKWNVIPHVKTKFKLTIKNLMFEKGNKASDWSPASQDFSSSIQSTLQYIEPKVYNITDYEDECVVRFEVNNSTGRKTDNTTNFKGICSVSAKSSTVNLQFVPVNANQFTANNYILEAMVPTPAYNYCPLSGFCYDNDGTSVVRYPLVVYLDTGKYLNPTENQNESSSDYLKEQGKYYSKLMVGFSSDAPESLTSPIFYIGGSYLLSESAAKYFNKNIYKSATIIDDEDIDSEGESEQGGEDSGGTTPSETGELVIFDNIDTPGEYLTFYNWTTNGTGAQAITSNQKTNLYNDGFCQLSIAGKSYQGGRVTKYDSKQGKQDNGTFTLIPSTTELRKNGSTTKNYYGYNSDFVSKGTLFGPIAWYNMNQNAKTLNNFSTTLTYHRGSKKSSDNQTDGGMMRFDIVLGAVINNEQYYMGFAAEDGHGDSNTKSAAIKAFVVKRINNENTTLFSKACGSLNYSWSATGNKTFSITNDTINTTLTFKYGSTSVSYKYTDSNVGKVNKVFYRTCAYRYSDGNISKACAETIKKMSLTVLQQ